MAKTTCDGCQKERGDVRSCGKDSNGDPDAPDLCFLCRMEGVKGRVYDVARQQYVDQRFKEAQEDAKENDPCDPFTGRW